jgi:hypothetical protein
MKLVVLSRCRVTGPVVKSSFMGHNTAEPGELGKDDEQRYQRYSAVK